MNRQLFSILLSLGLLLSACGEKPTPITATTPNEVSTQQISLPTATVTAIPVTATASPEPTPTPSPTPSAPHGTLSFDHEIGFGTGQRVSAYGLQLSADEKRLIATTSAGAFVFSAEDLSLLFSIREPKQQPDKRYNRHIRVSRDGSLAVSIGQNTDYLPAIKLWDMADGHLQGEYPLGENSQDDFPDVFDIDISLDNRQVMAVYENGLIQVVDAASGQVTHTIDQYINNTQKPLWIQFDPILKNAYYTFHDVASGVQSYGLNTTSWQEVSFADADTSDFPWNAAAFVPQLSKPAGFRWGYFTYLGGNRNISAWEYSTLGKRFDIRRQDNISALSISPDGQWVVMGGTDPTQLEVWAVETIKAPEQTFPSSLPLWAVAATSGGQSFYGISEDGTLSMWKNGQPDPVHQLQGFLPVAQRIAFTEDGLGLQLYTAKNEVYELNAQDGTLKSIYPDPNILEEMNDKIPLSATISPDKTQLAVIYFSLDDYAIRLFDLTTGKFIRKIPSKHRLEAIAFTPDGEALFTYGRKHPVQVLDIENGKVLNEITINEKMGESLYEMYLSRDKSTLVLWGELGTIEVYNAETLELRQTTSTDPDTWTVAISNDGSLLAYYTLSGSIGIWDVSASTMLPPLDTGLPALSAAMPGLAFSPDNHTLTISFWDGSIRFYDIAP